MKANQYPKKPDDLLKKDTLKLISLFQDNRENEEIVKQAFVTLCSRFRERVLFKCEKICTNMGHSISVAEMIADRAFRGYGVAKGFKIEKASTENVDQAFELYLLGIARRELVNYYRELKRKEEGSYYDGSEEVISELPDIDLNTLNLEDRIKHLAIDSLPPAHKMVYLTYMTHEVIGRNLPKKLRMELRDRLGGVEQVTVRGYKKEAIDKINSYTIAMRHTQEILKNKAADNGK